MADSVVVEGAEEYPAYASFDDMGLQADLLRNVYAYGFEEPSPIQQRAIKPIADGRDVVLQAPSGSGKTGAFLVGALQRADPTRKACQILVLAPTRELAGSIHRVAEIMSDGLGLRCYVLVGGTLRRLDAERLKEGQHLVVGTPGRVLDLIDRKDFKVRHLQVLVIDEADEMLSRDFRDQALGVCNAAPRSAQMCLASASMPKDILDLTARFMRNPLRIALDTEQVTLDGIRQYHIDVPREEWKPEVLCDLYQALTTGQTIIYCNTKRNAEVLAHEMEKRDFAVSLMHADLDQQERSLVMQTFRAGTTRVLIATDMLARGIDIQQVSHIINCDIPFTPEAYLHRIGRSGRFGRKGMAISLVTGQDIGRLKAIERHYRTTIPELPHHEVAGA